MLTATPNSNVSIGTVCAQISHHMAASNLIATTPSAASRLNLEIDAILYEIRKFAFLEENWNGYDVAKPDPKAISRAINWISEMYSLGLLYGWQQPSVGPDQDGAIVFEWHRGESWLSVTVSADDVTYLREGNWQQGENETGRADTPEHQETIWKWLMA